MASGKEKEKKELRLHSPSIQEPVFYDWPLVKTKQYDAAGEIIDSIRFVSEEHKELSVVMQKLVRINQTDTTSFEDMKGLCEQFSKLADTIRHLWRGSTRPNKPDQAHANKRLLRHVIQQVYNRSVTDPEKLNQHYEAFSPETYGETSFDMVEKVIEELKVTKKDVFLDLGSGVGQVVLHMAGGSKCKKAIGIEKADLPAQYAATMQKEFIRWMRWYGKQHKHFELLRGNFLDPKFRDYIVKEATIIFVNNYAFGPKLDHELKQIFQELPDGVRIVSSKPFCDQNARLSDRRMTDVSAIMDVKELTLVPSSVSWTCNNVPYFLHVVNRKKLERYFFEQKNPQFRDDIRRSSKSSSKSSSRESSHSREALSNPMHKHFDFEEEKALFGPTTRRQWNDWVSTQEKTRKEKGSKDSDARPTSNGSSTTSGSDETKKAKALAKEGRKAEKVSHKPGPGRPRKSKTELKAKATKLKYHKHHRRRSSSGHHRARVTVPLAPLVAKISAKKQEVQESIDLLHQHTLQSVSVLPKSPTAPEEGLVSLNVQSLRDLKTHIPHIPHVPIPLPLPPSPPPPPPSSRYPGLDDMFAQMKSEYVAMLEQMQTIEFRQQLVEAIQHEKTRNECLKQRSEHLKRQVDTLLEDGVCKLKQRLEELCIQATTPAELLNQSKEIVLRHKELQNHHALLQSEVMKLEAQNNGLVALCRDRDEHTVKSGILKSLGFDSTNVDTAKESILRDIGIHFGRQKALITEMTRIQSEVLSLQTSLPPSFLHLRDGNLLSAPPAPPSASLSAATPTSALTIAAKLPPDTTQPLTASTGIRGKRGRGAKSAGGPPRKRPTVAATQQSLKIAPEPKNAEEIERQIQDIVKKALSVDSAAKSAEKERRQRTAEKKKTSKPMPTPPAHHDSQVVPTDTTSPLPPTENPLPQVATFSSPGLVPVFPPSSSAATVLTTQGDQQQPSQQVQGPEEVEMPLDSMDLHHGSSPETESAPSDVEESSASQPEIVPAQQLRKDSPSLPVRQQQPPPMAGYYAAAANRQGVFLPAGIMSALPSLPGDDRPKSVPVEGLGQPKSGFLVNDLVGGGTQNGSTRAQSVHTILPSALP